MKFKVGNKVRRIAGPSAPLTIGEVYTVKEATFCHVALVETGGWYIADNFELAQDIVESNPISILDYIV
jgi:hypothetical protein